LREQLPALGLVLWGETGVPMPAPRSLTSGCTFLGTDGCQLSIDQRPCQCLALIPNPATLGQKNKCLCRMPEQFSRTVARQHWQDYWLTV